MRNVKLKILVGLPGSGKTTFAKKYKEKKGNNIHLIHIDEIKKEYWCFKDKTMKDFICSGLKGARNAREIVLDGLFLTNEDIENAIISIAEHFNETKVEIHRWNEDREICIKNDGGRREVSSVTTILNAPYEEIDIDKLNSEIEDCNAIITKIIPHKIELKPDWIRYTRPHAIIDEDGKLRSERWYTGGAYGNCWDSHLSPVSPEEPCDFTLLDNLLEKVCPDITFLHYKKIQRECVKTEESYESDYYGGGTNYMNWVCDLEKMYKIIKELGYLKE